MNKILLIVVAGLFVLTGCVKEGELNYTERRIVGEWYYETVRVSQGWGNDFITDQYHSIYLRFNSDFSFNYTDDYLGMTGTGVWDLTDTYNGEYSSDEIFISFTDDETGELYQIVFENISVTKNRINAQFRDKNTLYTYHLQKV